jgi:D-beta-D-heptose 7-phosphate kinase/D-beta-D-heptose 1-phosphate adenosyltransferase
MTAPALSPQRTREIVSRLRDQHVLVVGDVMLDRFIVGHVTRISPEAPVPVVRFGSEHVRLGGAANVGHNLAALGARVSLVGVVGRDAAGDRLAEALRAAGIDAGGLVVSPARTTTEKVRIVTERNQQVARLDYETDEDLAGEIERLVIERVAGLGPTARVLLVSDYLKGVITGGVMGSVLSAARAPDGSRPAVIVDPKVPHLDRYPGATLITPNHLEAEAATHRPIRTDTDAREAAVRFRRAARCESVLITRGEHGMWLSSPTHEVAIPAVAREVADVTGAGDTVVAALALALAAGASTLEAAILANQAAGLVVGKFGPATITQDELLDRFPLSE